MSGERLIGTFQGFIGINEIENDKFVPKSEDEKGEMVILLEIDERAIAIPIDDIIFFNKINKENN